MMTRFDTFRRDLDRAAFLGLDAQDLDSASAQDLDAQDLAAPWDTLEAEAEALDALAYGSTWAGLV